jgi:heat shock protein HslJ
MIKQPQDLDPQWVRALRRRGDKVQVNCDAWTRITTRAAAPQLPPNGRRVAQLAVLASVSVALIATILLVRARSHGEPIRSADPSSTTARTTLRTTSPAPTRGLFDRTWVLITARDHGRNVALLEQVQGAHLTFVRTHPCDATGCSKGPSVNGDDGCNAYSVALAIHGSNITPQTFGGTGVACSGPSNLISGVFKPRVPLRYRIIDDRLQLTSTNGTTLTYRATP